MMQTGLFQRLANDAGVTAIAAGRVFAIQAPDQPEVYPCVSYKMVGGSVDQQLGGPSGVRNQRVELTAHSLNADEAAALREAVIAALFGWVEILADGTNIMDCSLLNPGTDIEPGVARVFQCVCEMYVLYSPNY